ncbi:MAG: FMN-binding negative transcriptional regulator [Microvirga sp.]|nr:FMN-binding negative transcriptional regulator [Microvirga sp.]
MYVPPHFEETSRDAIVALIEAAPLACVVAQTQEGLLANHIPLLLASDGALIGHAALANDMHRLIAEGQDVLAVFRGEDAYISPNWYPSKAEHHRHVPTWNYEVVHVHGAIAFNHDEQAKLAAVGMLTRTHERRIHGKQGWRIADAPRDYLDEMLRNIVAFRIEPTRILAKSKLSQNRDERDHAGAVAGLRAAGQGEIARIMTERGSKSG